MEKKRIYINTFGCQQNDADSETLLGIAKTRGYEETACIEEADLILFNTCAVIFVCLFNSRVYSKHAILRIRALIKVRERIVAVYGVYSVNESIYLGDHLFVLLGIVRILRPSVLGELLEGLIKQSARLLGQGEEISAREVEIPIESVCQKSKNKVEYDYCGNYYCRKRRGHAALTEFAVFQKIKSVHT